MTIYDRHSPDLCAPSAQDSGAITHEDLEALFEHAAEAHAALVAGEVARYFKMVDPASDLTLMTPSGGFTRRSHPFSPEEIEEMRNFFRGGAGTAELVGAYASGDLAVLALVERARARIADLPEQDWSLRVTLAFRREPGGWRLVHRHADPLVARIAWDRAAELARA